MKLAEDTPNISNIPEIFRQLTIANGSESCFHPVHLASSLLDQHGGQHLTEELSSAFDTFMDIVKNVPPVLT